MYALQVGGRAANVVDNEFHVEDRKGVEWFWCRKCARAFKSKHALQVSFCVCACLYVVLVVNVCSRLQF